MFDITELLSSDGWVVCNKKLIRLYGLECAVLIGEFCSEYRYWKNNGTLEDGMFYSTQDNIEQNTGLNAHYQRKAINTLKEAGILEVVKKGLPAKNYYRLHLDVLTEIFSDESREALDSETVNLNNNKEKRINKNNSNSKELLQPSPSKLDNLVETFTSNSLENDFLNSGKKERKPKAKKKSLYEQCADQISIFTPNMLLQSELTDYLHYRLSIHDKPIHGVNQWKGMLNKLLELSKDTDQQKKIVNQSLEKGWLSFYELKTGNSSNKTDFGECGVVKSESYTDEELDELNELAKERERNGQRKYF